ncbi:MAG TPA: penicillin-binding transpeptidase domain-containing protein [Nitriliruptorales bacterium]|nr:penicillin-binding transpeptidase domain-containing protein [Nitriliruptorales bacterium]
MRDRLAIGFAVLTLGLTLAGGWYLLRPRDAPTREETAAATVARYVAAWEEGDWHDMRALVLDPPASYVRDHADTWAALGVRDSSFHTGPLRVVRGRAEATVAVHLRLDPDGELRYDTDLELLRDRGEWRVRWDPSVLHPALTRPGQRLERRVTEPTQRAPILAHDGTPLAGSGEVVEIGVHPARITSPALIVDALVSHAGADRQQVETLLARRPNPDWFHPVVTLPADEFEDVRDLLTPVPGVVVKPGAGRVLPHPAFAQHVLGRVGAITAELLEELGPAYRPDDRVGLSGLERRFEAQLRGTSVTELVVTTSDGDVQEVVAQVAGTAAEPLHTTLDRDVQLAVERALDGVDTPAAAVVIDAASGAVRASASRPLAAFDRALTGQYAPGTAFLPVTATVLLARYSADAPVQCPPEAVVGGARIANLVPTDGAATLGAALGRGCHTAVAQLVAALEPGDLTAGARAFGFDADSQLALPAAGGRFPEPVDLAERAAAAVGHGRVQASPLHLASVAAAVADGSWRRPHLLADAADGQGRTIPAAPLGALRSILTQAVTSGGATGAAVPGRQVRGLAGVSHSADGPPHAWFIGDVEGLALAVLVEGGGEEGGARAARVAAAMVAGLPR